MPKYTYKAKDRSGALVEGSLDAEERSAVTAHLQQKGLFPVSITGGKGGGGGTASRNSLSQIALKKFSASKTATPKMKKGNGASAPAKSTTAAPKPKSKAAEKKAPPKAKAPAQKKPPQKAKPKPKSSGVGTHVTKRRKRITAADMATFNRQLADLLSAGVPLVKSLGILQKQSVSEQFTEVIAEINGDVQDGATFADALAKHPRLFSRLYTAMVRSGEAGGMLDGVLQRLADFSEQEEQLKGKIKSALAYPVVMIIAGSLAVIVMFTYVIPKIVATFEQLNQTLPAMTQLLISTSKLFQNYWYFMLGGAALLGIAIWQFLNTEQGRSIWHHTQLKVPLLGDLVKKREVALFSRTLGSLLKNGVSILTALGITKDVLNNTVTKAEVEEIIDEITQGASIATPLRHSQVFPPVTVNMMAVGEETGQLENVLLRISESFEMEVERKVRTLTSLIEPIIIVAMGLVVGFIVIAMLLPIFSLDPTGGVG
mgnify:CR=1 FL=1